MEHYEQKNKDQVEQYQDKQIGYVNQIRQQKQKIKELQDQVNMFTEQSNNHVGNNGIMTDGDQEDTDVVGELKRGIER